MVAIGHGRRVQVLHDAPCFGRPVRVRWFKRIWRCDEESCPKKTWTEQHPFAAARAKLTARAIDWAVDALRHDDTTVAALAPPARRRLGHLLERHSSRSEEVDLESRTVGEDQDHRRG